MPDLIQTEHVPNSWLARPTKKSTEKQNNKNVISNKLSKPPIAAGQSDKVDKPTNPPKQMSVKNKKQKSVSLLLGTCQI